MMKHRSLVFRVIAMVFSVAAMLCACVGLQAPYAHAEETGSITVDFSIREDGMPEPIEGAQFNLYKIGEWDGSQGKYVPVAPFDKDPFDQIGGTDDGGSAIGIVDIMGAGADQLRQLSTTLSFTIKQLGQSGKGIEPAAQTMTNAEGVARFDGLVRGLYLVDAPIHQIQSTTAQGKTQIDEYVISSSLVALPNVNSDSPMDVAITAKATHSKGIDPIHVEKVWKNDDPATRPKSIKVSLWMEGEDTPIGSAELSAENDWKHVWDNLPVSNRYFVVEDDVPDGYHVFIDEDILNPETADFTITNSKPQQPVTPVTPQKPPAQTGADIALVVVIAGAAFVLGTLLIVKARRAEG